MKERDSEKPEQRKVTVEEGLAAQSEVLCGKEVKKGGKKKNGRKELCVRRKGEKVKKERRNCLCSLCC